MRTYTAASFFSGIGGIDLPFSWLGFDIRLQVEIDPYCQKVLRKHRARYWKHAKIEKDIRNVSGKKYRNIDVMFGGFPCQDISIAGKRAGVTEQTRSGLWFEFLRIIGEARPRAILLENVSNISMVGGTTVTATLAEIGYDAIWYHVRASDVNAPHQRERWFCIAIRESNALDNANRKRYRKPSTAKRFQNNRTWRRATQQRTQHTDTTRGAGQGIRGRKLGYAKKQRLERLNRKKSRLNGCARPSKRQRNYKRTGTQSRLGRTAYGVSARLDRHRGRFPARPFEVQHDYEPPRVTDRKLHRVDRVKALGNAVVPQQVLPFARAIRSYLDITQAS